MGYSFVMSTSIKQVKGLELILSVPFRNCCSEPTACGQRINPCKWNRWLLGNKSIREITGTLGVAKSTVWYILKKRQSTSAELRNIKRTGRLQRTTVVDDQKILSMVKTNPFTTSSKEKNTLQEVDVSLSKSTFKRRRHDSKYRGTNKARLDFAKNF